MYNETLLAAFISLLDKEYNAEHRKVFTSKIKCEPGPKFVRVIEEGGHQNASVRYFVEKATGNIYGAEGYRKPNIKRLYGTLETINEWNWAGYYAVKKQGPTQTLVPKDQRRKAGA